MKVWVVPKISMALPAYFLQPWLLYILARAKNICHIIYGCSVRAGKRQERDGKITFCICIKIWSFYSLLIGFLSSVWARKLLWTKIFCWHKVLLVPEPFNSPSSPHFMLSAEQLTLLCRISSVPVATWLASCNVNLSPGDTTSNSNAKPSGLESDQK